MIKKILDTARGEIGYHEGAGNDNKYGVEYTVLCPCLGVGLPVCGRDCGNGHGRGCFSGRYAWDKLTKLLQRGQVT